MFKNIIKRDGRFVPFNPEKITLAISKAGKATGEFDYETAKKLTIKVLLLAEEFIRDRDPHVEEIQDIVEEILISSPYKKTAKAYIIYRDQHARMREIARQGGLELVDAYLSKVDWRIKENSNMSFSLQGLNNYISSEISKSYWLHKIYPPEVRDAHINGDIHIHDLNVLAPYCVGWDMMDLLIRGFGGVSGKVESLPPKHFRSALGQIVNFLYTLQGESAGAQAFSNIDTLLAPFIAYDGLNYKQVKQALQEWVFNLNVPTRVGFQTPFTNITIDLKVPEHMKNQAVIIRGSPQDAVYGEFQKEMDMFNQALFEVLSEGDARGRVFTFPIPTINITKDFEWSSPVVDLIMEATAKYGIPYFANYVNSDLKPEDARSMCCRLRLETRKLRHRGGGLFGSNPLTGSIGVVTVNLPRIGYLASSKEEFIASLLKLMDIAKTSLEIKRKVLERFTEAGLYPYSKYYLSFIKEKTGQYWSNHFSTIGIIGMNEAIANLYSKAGSNRVKGIWNEEGRNFALKAMDLIREKLIEYQEETQNLYNLEATPAEGTSYRLARIDRQKYPDIITQGRQYPYYTNSTWLPVNFTESITYLLDHQDELQSRYTGGTVLHLFLGEKPEKQKLKNFIKTVFEIYHLPYISITPTFSVCPECGYIEGEHSACPKCNTPSEVYSRVVGYLRPVDNWNEGKKEEFKERKYLKMV